MSCLGDDIENYIEELIESEPIDQIGIPTGFPIYDHAIGGGLRRGTITIKGARPKKGKSWDALNLGRNVASRGIPVLYLDTELTESYQRNRLLSIDSGCPINFIETRKFNKSKDYVGAVRESGHRIKKYPFTYKSISGMSHTEALAIARRWIVKEVGFNSDGKANDCVIVYDYMKLTSGDALTKVTPEYIVLGLMLTEMHNFAVKYDIPIAGYVQLNRDGIDGEETNVVAASDRVLWLASSLTLLKNKDQTDEDLGCGFQNGNKKLIVVETRQGSGLALDRDYINLHCSLRPRVEETEATGLMREGLKFSDVAKLTGEISGNSGENKPNNPRRDQGSGQRKD